MRHRVPKIVFVLVAALALAGSGCQKEPEAPAFALPADLLALLPAAPSAIVVVASLDAVDAARTELEAGAGGEPLLPAEALAALDLRAALETHMPGMGALVATDRPVALAVTAPAPMATEASMTLLLPLREPTATLPQAPPGHGEPVRRGDYLAWSSLPGYAPADTVPELAHHLRGGLVTAAVDLAGIIRLYRPMIEMGLGAMAMAGAQGGPGTEAGMSAEEAQVLVGLVRKVMDALVRLDVTADLAAGDLSVSSLLGIAPGSALDPGPQADFATALELSGFLPPDADMVEVIALDQSRQIELFRDVYLMGLERETASLPPDKAAKYQQWFASYLDLYDMFACPTAVSVDFADAGLQMLLVARPDDAAAMTRAVADQMSALSDVGLGVVFTPLESTTLGSHTVRRWQVDLDPEALAAWEADAPDSPGAMQAAQMTMVLRDLLPSLALVEAGPHVLFGATADDAAFADFHARVRRGGADPESRAARAGVAAGPDCHEVVVGDLAPMFNWFARIAGDLGAAGDLPTLGTPVPYTLAVTVAPGGYGLTISTDVPAIRAAAAAIRALDEMD